MFGKPNACVYCMMILEDDTRGIKATLCQINDIRYKTFIFVPGNLESRQSADSQIA